jgi:hypothetical protein
LIVEIALDEALQLLNRLCSLHRIKQRGRHGWTGSMAAVAVGLVGDVGHVASHVLTEALTILCE